MCIGWKLVEKSDRFAYSQSGKNKLDVRNPAEKTAKASSKKEKRFYLLIMGSLSSSDRCIKKNHNIISIKLWQVSLYCHDLSI